MNSQLFPEGYRYWLEKRLLGSRSESLATCENCAMVKPSGTTRDKGPFLSHLKCCTYFPFIPNFSLGDIRSDKIKRAKSNGILLPIGLFPSQNQQDLVIELGSTGFGRRSELLCPFFDSIQNQCSIWEQRPGVCTSYFCKSEKGKKGLHFWSEVEKYLNHFEWKLSCEVIFQMGFTENEIAYCQGAIDLETAEEERKFFVQAAWGKWQSKKIEFYKQSRAIALSISSDEIGEILDPEFLILESRLSKA
jgi:Fe-S-cluster containining protein